MQKRMSIGDQNYNMDFYLIKIICTMTAIAITSNTKDSYKYRLL